MMSNNQKKNPDDLDLGQPIDPTTNPQGLMNDTYGLTGITVSGDPINQSPHDDSPDTTPSDLPASDEIVHRKQQANDQEWDNLQLAQVDDSTNETIDENTPPSVLGEQMVSGDMPDPESDDDTLLNSHQVGLRMDEDYENPQPLDTARDVQAAEAERRGLGDFDLD